MVFLQSVLQKSLFRAWLSAKGVIKNSWNSFLMVLTGLKFHNKPERTYLWTLKLLNYISFSVHCWQHKKKKQITSRRYSWQSLPPVFSHLQLTLWHPMEWDQSVHWDLPSGSQNIYSWNKIFKSRSSLLWLLAEPLPNNFNLVQIFKNTMAFLFPQSVPLISK